MRELVGIVGNNADVSTNRALLAYMQARYQKEAKIELMEVKNWPVFNKDGVGTRPAEISKAIDQIERAEGVIIATPEYNLSIPAALSNALSWLACESFPLVDKPTLIVGASYGTLGTSRAQGHLRSILNAPVIRAMVMPGPPFLLGHSLQAFDDQGQLQDPVKVAQLDGYFEAFQSFIQMTQGLSGHHEANVLAAQSFYQGLIQIQEEGGQ